MNILFIDWENFRKKLEAVLEKEKAHKPKWSEYNFVGLFSSVLPDIKIDKKIFYAAKISLHPLTLNKSKELIEEQRLLKTYLERQGFEFIYGGRVRGIVIPNNKGKKNVIFREKGVDVQIAVDILTLAFRRELLTAIIASSDSDLQPALKVLRNSEIDCIYLGFELEPNKGLLYTTKRAILIRNSEVIKFLPQKLFNK